MTDPRSSLPGVPASLVDRAKNILLTPKTEWPRIDGETTTVSRLITGYAVILAALAPVAMLIGLFLGPLSVTSNIGFLVKILLVIYGISLGTVLILGLLIDMLAPTFGAAKNSVQAMKLAVYSGTAFWAAAISLIIPGLWWLWLVGGVGYGGFLLWQGLPILMRVPADKVQGYAAAAIGIWVLLFIILQQVAWRVIWGGMVYGMM